jgi:hypothetical protein
LTKKLLGKSQHTPMSIQESPFQVDMVPSKSKRRASNFTVKEDKFLISTWLNTSLDPVQGNEQKLNSFYTRIWVYFHKFKEFDSDRNMCFVMNQWSAINSCTSKFCGYLIQVESIHQSGITEANKVNYIKSCVHTLIHLYYEETNYFLFLLLECLDQPSKCYV